jgi:hypothetical protein
MLEPLLIAKHLLDSKIPEAAFGRCYSTHRSFQNRLTFNVKQDRVSLEFLVELTKSNRLASSYHGVSCWESGQIERLPDVSLQSPSGNSPGIFVLLEIILDSKLKQPRIPASMRSKPHQRDAIL